MKASRIFFASTLITGMWVGTVLMLVMLVRHRAAHAPSETVEILKQPVH